MWAERGFGKTEGVLALALCRHLIYPRHPPLRDYQYSISYTALNHNTLVCLPTGLGKTHIAAVVMYNMYRWFPQVRGKWLGKLACYCLWEMPAAATCYVYCYPAMCTVISVSCNAVRPNLLRIARVSSAVGSSIQSRFCIGGVCNWIICQGHC